MANREKHLKNPVLEAFDEEAPDVPTRARSAAILGHYIKGRKRVPGHPPVPPEPYRPEPAEVLRGGSAPIAADPAPRSPLASFEHLKKKQRLKQLRARDAVKRNRG
jgi:hypothetical protein